LFLGLVGHLKAELAVEVGLVVGVGHGDGLDQVADSLDHVGDLLVGEALAARGGA
jgi:hypothetical protein